MKICTPFLFVFKCYLNNCYLTKHYLTQVLYSLAKRHNEVTSALRAA